MTPVATRRRTPATAALMATLAWATVLTGGEPPRKKNFEAAEYWPLKAGAEWVYAVDGGGDNPVTLAVAQVKDVGGEARYKLEAWVFGKAVAAEWLLVRPDGLYRAEERGQELDPPVCFFKG